MFGLQFGLGLGARRAPQTHQAPVTIFAADPALDADDNNINTTFRVSGTITGDAQTQLRITLAPGSTNALTVVGLGFGKRDTGVPLYPNTLTTPVEALFGGLSGFSSATTPQTSDWIDCSGLDLNEGDQIVVSYTTGGSGQASTRINASATNADTYWQTGTYWDIADVSGLGFNTLDGKNYAVVSVETRSGGGPSDGIPMSWDDSRFASNTAGSGSTVTNATYENKDWNDNPSYTSAVPCFVWEGDATDVLTMSQCRVDFREGPRIGGGSTPRATLDIDQCFINCVGKTGDHADGLQAYSPGGQALVDITNSCLRSYTDAEAVSKYGAGFIGSASLFWADNFQGEVRMTNVLIHGGGRGIAIYADTGTTRISFENVFFVPSPDGWTYFDYDIRATGGTLIVDKWVNVRAATIVDGVIIPGASLPSP